MSNRPAWAVEVSPTTDPFDDAPSWEDETAHVRGITYSRGRQQELDVIQPGTATITVDNSARRFDPNNTAGPHYPNLLPGKRVRIRTTYGAEGLLLPGAAADYASSPDTGWVPGQELDLRARLSLPDWTPAATGIIFGQTDATFAQASVIWGVTSAGELSLTWFTAGGAIVAATSSALGFENGSTHDLRVTLDVDNGAGSYEVKFYETTDDGASWQQIGSTVTGAATAVPRNSTQAITLGSSTAGFPLACTIELFTFGVTIGAENMRVRFTDGQRFVGGASSGTGTLGSVWTLHGAASFPARVRTRFGGFAEGWPVPARSLGEAPVELVDGFGLLSAAEIPDGSPFEATIRSLGPVNYWKLTDAQGSDDVADYGSSPTTGHAIGGAPDVLGSPGIDAGSDATALALDGFDTSGYVDVSGLEGSDWSTLVALLKPTAPGNKRGIILDTPDRIVAIASSVDAVPGALLAIDRGSNGDRMTAPLTADVGHVVVIRRTGAAAFTFEIDGQAVADASTSSLSSGNGVVGSRIGWSASTLEESLTLEAGYKGTIQHLALFDRVLSSAESGAVASGAGVWIGDTIDSRLDRLLDLAGWPASERDLDPSEVGTLGAGTVGTDALEDARTLERSEFGAFYQTPDYVARFRSRYATVTDPRSTAVRYTFTDEAGTQRFRFDDLELAPQGIWIRNRVTVGWLGGSITVEDPDSITAYGPREHSVDTILTTAAQAQSLGELILARFAEPVVRVSSLSLDLAAEPIGWEPVLDLEIGDRVRVVWTPGNVGDPIEVEGLVDGIKVTAGDGVRTARATLYLSGAYDLELWRWGVSLWGSSTRWG